MCNSLSLPQSAVPSTSVSKEVMMCSNTKVMPQYSPGKIAPKLADHNTPPNSSSKEAQFPSTVSLEDDAIDPKPKSSFTTIESLRKGQNLAGSKLPFLWKLHILLNDVEATGNDHIVSWLDKDVMCTGFKVYRPKAFMSKIVPHYFAQTKYKSFQRQLHLYEFIRTQYGPEAGSYSHPLFVRGQPDLCLSLSPIKIKGKGGRKAQLPSSQKQVTTGKRPREASFSTTTTVPSAVLCKREQEEWVAKIKQMLVKGSTLAAELNQKQQHQSQQPQAIVHPNDTTSKLTDQQGDSQGILEDMVEDETCSVFGGNFHLMPNQENVSACEHCCESDTEDDQYGNDDMEWYNLFTY